MPREKKVAKYEASPAKLLNKTAYMREYGLDDEEELRERIQNSKMNKIIRNRYRDQMRTGTIVLSKSALSSINKV